MAVTASGNSPPPPTTSYILMPGDKNLRLSAGAVARMDGVVVGTYTGQGSNAVSEEFLQQVTRVLALRCASLPSKQRSLKFSETTCSEKVNFYFGMDEEGRIFLVGVDKAYPARVAFLAVEELAKTWAASKSGARSMTCVEDGCKLAVRECVVGLARRYEDVEEKDQITRIQQGVDGVREQMQINITKALEGLQTTEEILVRSEELKAGALVFKKNATTLNKIMWWQKTRYQLMVGGLVVGIVVVLGLALGLTFRK